MLHTENLSMLVPRDHCGIEICSLLRGMAILAPSGLALAPNGAQA
jgi:hypothetical protein